MFLVAVLRGSLDGATRLMALGMIFIAESSSDMIKAVGPDKN